MLFKLVILLSVIANPLIGQIPSFFNKSVDWKEDMNFVNVHQPSKGKIDAVISNPINYAVALKQEIEPVHLKEEAKISSSQHSKTFYLGFQSKDAKAIGLRISELKLPNSANLYFLNPYSNEFIGPITNEDISNSNRMFSGFIAGDKIVVEVNCPNSKLDELSLTVNALEYGFDLGLINDGKSILGFGDALACEVNVNCSENTLWQEARKSVCRISVVTNQATYWCSGSLMNNTSEDKHPYVLTAKHCYFNEVPQYDMWVFDFGYESDACSNPSVAPSFNSIFGAEFVAERTDSDFLLVELDNPVPDSYDVVYSGWDRSEVLADTSAMIGHPVGDIKKISIDYDQAEIHPTDLDFGVFIAPANHFYELEFDLGVFEGGSSGGPMLNQDARLVGQLTGGFADACNSEITYYGRFSRSWNDGSTSSSRLKEWLDPLGTNPETLDMLIPESDPFNSISGAIQYFSSPIVNVQAILTGAVSEVTTTDDSGVYLFEDLSGGLDYSLNFSKNSDLTNGVTTLDAVFIQKHILGITPFDDPYTLIAADVNNNGSVSTLDIVFMQKAILGLETSFPNNESWRFVPENYVFDDPLNPFNADFPEGFDYIDLNTDMNNQNLIGIKVGDVNGNANPNL